MKAKVVTCDKRNCKDTAVRHLGHQYLCAKHYRFWQMRNAAMKHKKTVPSIEQLEQFIIDSNGLVCRHCGRVMNWLSKNGGASTVVSLQHYRNGEMALICMACNTRHAFMEGDSFCDLPPDKRACSRCKIPKPFDAFYSSNDAHAKRWMNIKGICIACLKEQFKKKQLEKVRAKQLKLRQLIDNPDPKQTKGIEQRGSRWIAAIRVNYKAIHLGSFSTQEEAATAYNKAALRYFGDGKWRHSPN